jgi:hypothetical protein
VRGCDVEDLVRPEPAARSEREGDPLLPISDAIEELVDLLVGEPYAAAVVAIVEWFG